MLINGRSGHEVIFFMLYSAEHENLNVHECNNITKFGFFSGSDKPRMLVFLLIKIEMPTIVGIYEQEKIYAQLSLA